MSLLHEQPNRVWEGSSIVIVIKFRSKRPGFSAANSSASWVFRCTKLEWLNPTQQGTRADVPLALLSKLLYETVSLSIGGGTSVRVPCYVGFSHSNLVHLNPPKAHEVAALKPTGVFVTQA